jgi:triacylglycerol lipase
MNKELSKEISASSFKCKTKFPIILIHGTGFRDHKFLNYWGRIPKALENQGAEIFYSNQDAWGIIEKNAEMIKNSILEVLTKSGSEKVNLIAHSKGGLEARYMIHELGMDQYVASLTTISTPHHGSKTMDLFFNFPLFLYKFISIFVNLYFKLLGDKEPDFYKASRQLSTICCKDFNHKIENAPCIYYQSYTSIMKNSLSDIFLFFPHFFIKRIEGDNDGMVAVNSAKWGDFKGVITGKHLRGISHADIVDLRRLNYSGFDIREIYISIVESLKDKGF